MPALQKVWFIGDEFLRELFVTDRAMRTQATQQQKMSPYLYDYYNIECYYTNPLSSNRSILARILNALIAGLNKNEHLPRYIVMMMDKDVVSASKIYDYGAVETFEKLMCWLLNNVTRNIEI